MRVKDEELSGRWRSNVDRIMTFSVPFATALMVAVSWVTVAVVFLSHAEIREISADSASVMKLIAGATLLFLTGIYFMQQLAGRQIQNQGGILYERNASALASMREAMHAHIERQPEATWQRDRPEA
jgi:ABC-type nickel/cobalt efflux system permease component RcnA